MIDNSKYRSIIFDLGGVILNIDYSKTIEAFNALDIKDFELAYTQAQQTGLFDDIETGKITESQFRDGIRKLTTGNITDMEIDNAWNSMLLDLPEKRLQVLSQLKKTHRLFLLSNTNVIHIKRLGHILNRDHGLRNLDAFFEKVHYSHEMGLRKPDPAIFKKVIAEHDLNPSQTLFIDDSIQHVLGAKKTGLQAYHLKNDQTILDLFLTR